MNTFDVLCPLPSGNRNADDMGLPAAKLDPHFERLKAKNEEARKYWEMHKPIPWPRIKDKSWPRIKDK